MPRYIAFLRAINVGGHVVKMEKLRELFGELGFSKIETFINSGNVIFDSRSSDSAALEKKIEKHLTAALGYPVAAFLRTPEQVAAIGRLRPFEGCDAAPTFCIGFLAQPLTGPALESLMRLRTGADQLHVHDREIYWLSALPQSKSKFSNAVCERAMKAKSTFRSVTTVTKLAEKYA